MEKSRMISQRGKLVFDADTTYFTSDTHFGHANIIRFCNRPYKDVDEMNEALIANWNSVVSESDTVFHLGDFAFGGQQIWNDVLDRLNGKIYLIMGNHDMKNLRGNVPERFADVQDQMQIRIGDRHVYLNHYPFLCYGGAWRNENEAVWQLFGHVHSGPKCAGKDYERLVNLFPIQYDVGVDNNGYFPVSWKTVCDRIKEQCDKKTKNDAFL